jgi:D-alanyl-D-alanine dipeptidase
MTQKNWMPAFAGMTAVLLAACAADRVRLTPVRPVPELVTEALQARPPVEKGKFVRSDLVEIVKLDPTIRLDIRYAGEDNFLGTPFYPQPRAFLQRPAAEALVRAHRTLKPLGYGLLVHDAYRPWYVTKVFWDAVPDDKKMFVADPKEGSRHNRGCAVDLTLYDLATGAPVEMPSAYDETTERAHSDYGGGAEAQRLRRGVLRVAMESQGFTVFPLEWWHFDFDGWEKYRIGNQRFEDL